MLRTPHLAAGALLLGGLATAGCTNTEASVNRNPHRGTVTAQVVDGLQEVTVQTGDDYRFDPSAITVHPGKVQIVLVNVGKGAPHNWTLSALNVGTPLASAGTTESLTFTSPSPGTYKTVCTIHEKQGQTGQLVVLPS